MWRFLKQANAGCCYMYSFCIKTTWICLTGSRTLHCGHHPVNWILVQQGINMFRSEFALQLPPTFTYRCLPSPPPSTPLPFSQVAQLPVANLALHLLIYLCRFSQCNQFNFWCPLYHPHLYLHWWTCYHCHLEERWDFDNSQCYPPADQEISWSC